MTLASRTRQMIRTAHVLVLAIAAASPQLHAQTPRPQATFRGGTDLVQVDVAVLDGKRRPVRGLTAQDFPSSRTDSRATSRRLLKSTCLIASARRTPHGRARCRATSRRTRRRAGKDAW